MSSCLLRPGSLVSWWLTSPATRTLFGIVADSDPRFTDRPHDTQIFWSSGLRGHFSWTVIAKAIGEGQLKVEVF